MPPSYFPLRWESTGDQWWYASPIDCAAANGHYDLVRELLHLDTNLLIKLTSLRRIRRLETVWDDESQSNEVAKCRSQVAQKLLIEGETDAGHNSLIRAGYGGWLLYTAASAGDVAFVQELLERDPFLVFGEGEYGVTDILYCRGEEQEFGGLFIPAARGGNVEILREILGDCEDVLVYRDAQGSTVLHSAAGRGQVEVVQDLLASYDIIAATDDQGNTALNMAAYRGYLPVVEVLISASPSITSITNNYGETFLHMAVAGFRTPGFHRLDRQIELIKQLVHGNLINLEEIVNVANNDGRTALHMAVIENIQSDLVELLMNIPSINLNIRDANGMTPLDLLKQRPRSASSDIVIKQLISAGGISDGQDYKARTALVSHLKMQGIGASPGTSFRIPDAEIFLYTGIDDVASDTEYGTCSSALTDFNSPAISLDSRKSSSVNKAAMRFKMFLQWPRKERKTENRNLGDDYSLDSYEVSRNLEAGPTPLRQRFSKQSSFQNNKRIFSLGSGLLPSPSVKKEFASRLMHGVIQVQSPSSPFSESSRSSTASIDKHKGMDAENEIQESFSSNHSPNSGKLRKTQEHSSFNKKLLNQYLCFGAQGLAVEDSISRTRSRMSFRRSLKA
ncbi:hypothetical protein Vadar_008748 [Vaccinium darrowii]|uniref:Uncharacterized protein n=1 Tax=Vaccinium darrowii TaxID=229202 RepID=A0ACB7YU23_9ERIC|nr:hypothetical protein Vadar_008748 [Vaccinium darrowii]